MKMNYYVFIYPEMILLMSGISFTLSENINLAPYCSMKAGGNAKYFVEPKTEAELLYALKYFKAIGERYIVVGKCSNLLFPDSGFDGAVISACSMKGMSVENGIVTAMCGETLSSLATTACENSITGFEFCYGIPGSVGGGVYMNAGAYGGELSNIFVSGRFINESLEIATLTKEEMDFGYRKSRMAFEGLILISASFKGEEGNKDEIRSLMDELMAKRKRTQPLEYPSCGSAFKRPVGNFAGALIEQCGLKGTSVGGAEVSEKHAGFIINKNNAPATDVINLLNLVSDTVFEKTGVRLEPEIRIIE